MTFTPTQIPGMIEPVERELLMDLAEYVALGENEIVCEFGSYFGLSTRCLAEGLLKNSAFQVDRRRQFALHAYDIFSCSQAGALARCVRRDAVKAGLTDLLRVDGERVDFAAVFDHHMKGLPPMLLARHQTDIASARHVGGSIALMHIDAPKWFVEYRQLLREFGPHLKPGALLVFQDYFYHWSAELIAAVELFIESGRFEPIDTAATSLLVRVSGPVDGDALASLETRLVESDIGEVIARAIARFSAFEVDRPEIFVSRLYLAGMQHSFERGDHMRSGHWLRQLHETMRGAMPSALVADLAELTQYGFSIRKLYEQDTTS